jgi:Rieske Fe-S protein
MHSRCLDRRTFLAQGALAGVAAVLAACGDGQVGDSPTAPTGGVDLTVRLADYPALGTVGGIVRLNGTATPIAVVRSADAAYRAFSMVCTHQGTTINITASGFQCPNHGATFNAAGTWVSGQFAANLFEYRVVPNPGAGTLRITS